MPDTKRDILFLLGAGASKDAGLPLAVEITDRISEDIESRYPALVPLIRFVHGGICFGRGCSGKRPDERVNVEEFLIACQDLATRSTSSLYPFVASWHEKLAEVGQLPRDIDGSGATNAFDFIARHCKRRLREWLTVTDTSRAKYFRNLKDFIAAGYRLQFHKLVSRPFLLASMVLLAAAFSLRFARMGGVQKMVLGGVLSGFLLYVLSKITEDMSKTELVTPMTAAWAPVLIGALTGFLVLLYQEDG